VREALGVQVSGVSLTARANARPGRILRALAEAPAGLSTPQLVEKLGERSAPNQQVMLSWYGEILRKREQRGEVARAGTVPGRWQQGPAVRWAITDAGRARLAEMEAGPGRARIAAERKAAQAAERARLLAHRERLLADADRDYGAGVTAAERRRIVPALRAAGCTLADIGSVFGVTGEQIRHDLVNGPDYEPRPPGRRPGPPRPPHWASPRRRALERLAAEQPERFAVILADESTGGES